MSRRAILTQKNFRFLWASQLVSVLGDQFTLLALPWLVLQTTHSPLEMGMVLAVMGLPRAVFMLVGGAAADRYSPRSLILATNLIRLVLVGGLGSMVLSGTNEMSMVYLFALLFGLADAFFYPAVNAILPQVVEKNQLEPANAIIQGTAHLSAFVGPALAGTVIAVFARRSDAAESTDTTGIGIALLIDAVTFLLSALLIWNVQQQHEHESEVGPRSGVLREIADGIRLVWNDLSRRTVFLGLIAITLLISSPLAIGLPVLADQRLSQGAAGLGSMSAAWGLGAIVGNLVAGNSNRPSPGMLGPVMFCLLGMSGVCLALLSGADDVYSASAVLFVIGISDGYCIVHLMTWFQRTTPNELMGRVMSLMMFSMIGLAPLTQIAFGFLIERDLGGVLLISGVLMAVLCGVLALTPGVRRMGDLEDGALRPGLSS